ncbi:hypothetical protein [Microbispora sp. NPDC046933]|uniref:hypothetical protein n=1 Tax=Microbispora sp. NPDC046933 TaxID=3155618 RepID=UPI0033FC7DE8
MHVTLPVEEGVRPGLPTAAGPGAPTAAPFRRRLVVAYGALAFGLRRTRRDGPRRPPAGGLLSPSGGVQHGSGASPP